MKSALRTLLLCLLAALAARTTAAAEPAGTTAWELWLPPSGKPVSAVFVAPRWGDGANMVKLIQTKLGEELGIATMLTRGDKLTFKADHFVPSIAATLTAAAAERKHPSWPTRLCSCGLIPTPRPTFSAA